MSATPDVQFACFESSHLDSSGLPQSRLCPFPRLSRAAFLDPNNLATNGYTLEMTNTMWRADLFRRAGNSLDLTLKEAVDYELFARFLRHSPITTLKMSLESAKLPMQAGARAYSLRYTNEALMVIRREQSLKPLSEADEYIPPAVKFSADEPVTSAPPLSQAYQLAQTSRITRLIHERGPTISIVTPSFNQAQYLEATIDSILSQGYPRLQYIIIDGGSTDGSIEVIKKYERYLQYWCSERDGGHYFAVQKGLDRSSGEILTWLNSDDMLQPSALQHVALMALAYPDVLWMTGISGSISPSGALDLAPTSRVTCRERYLMEGFDNPWIQQEGTFWRRSLWEQAGGALDCRLSLAADVELWRRFFRYAPLQSVEVPLGLFRVQPRQRSQLLLADYIREAEAVRREELSLIQRGIFAEMIPIAPVIRRDELLAAAERVVESAANATL